MPSISVCLSPQLAVLQHFEGKIAVVVDILRATTTIITALKHGVKSIRPVDSIRLCHDFQKKGYIGAAERSGKIVEGFKLGNSPLDYINSSYAGEKIVFTTTNGTKTIRSIKGAERIIFGAFINLQAIADFLVEIDKDITIICAGWEDEVNLEDTLFAGALIDKMKSSFNLEGDPAILAHKFFLHAKGNLSLALQDSSHILRLRKLELQKDIDFCLTQDIYRIIPELVNGEIVTYSHDKELKL
jgi:2-phosphosulfolactate phosphatase